MSVNPGPNGLPCLESRGALIQLVPLPLASSSSCLGQWVKEALSTAQRQTHRRLYEASCPERFEQAWRPASMSVDLLGRGLLIVDRNAPGSMLGEAYQESQTKAVRLLEKFQSAHPEDGLLVVRRFFQMIPGSLMVAALYVLLPKNLSEIPMAASAIGGFHVERRIGRDISMETDGFGAVLEALVNQPSVQPQWKQVMSIFMAHRMEIEWPEGEVSRSPRPRF